MKTTKAAKKPARKAPRKETVHAEIAIIGAADMPARLRRQIAEWLRNHADDLLANGNRYDRRFTGDFRTA